MATELEQKTTDHRSHSLIGTTTPPSQSLTDHGGKPDKEQVTRHEDNKQEDNEPIKVKPFMSNTMVICAFVNLGKSVYCENHDDSKDIDTSLYARKPDGRENPEYPDNYIDIIKHHLSHCNWKYLFVSSNRNIRQKLDENKIKYIVLYPTKDRKDEWIANARNRGNTDRFIDKVITNWDAFIDELAALPNSYGLRKGEFINDNLFNNRLKHLKL